MQEKQVQSLGWEDPLETRPSGHSWAQNSPADESGHSWAQNSPASPCGHFWARASPASPSRYSPYLSALHSWGGQLHPAGLSWGPRASHGSPC